MSCSTCGTKDGKVAGCQSNGSCSSGGCNRMNTFAWLNDDIYFDDQSFQIIEISFKNGIHKAFYRNTQKLVLEKGMLVCVESSAGYGYDIGAVSLMGEMVKWQMKKRHVKEDHESIKNILRVAKPHEIELLGKVRAKEKEDMIRARAIARELKLNMKIADLEYQADGKKCTYYYIADGRVDFRELIKVYARDFGVKVEMRQIGIRQEAALVGGIGVCGRELCCSTWLTEFKSVNTSIARYQQLAINQQKLSGQCGRLKCCLNYELDTYVEALQVFPKIEKLHTQKGEAILIKTDVFGRKMVFLERQTNHIVSLDLTEVQLLIDLNKKGTLPESIKSLAKIEVEKKEFVDDTSDLNLTLRKLEKTVKKRKDRERKNNPNSNPPQRNHPQPKDKPNTDTPKSTQNPNNQQNQNRNKNFQKPRGPKPNPNPNPNSKPNPNPNPNPKPNNKDDNKKPDA